MFKKEKHQLRKPHWRDYYTQGVYDANGERNSSVKLAQVIALINPYTLYINHTTSTSSMIIDSTFPAREACSADSVNTIFGRQFGIPCKIIDKNGLYEELPMMKCCVYTLYQLEVIII